MTLEEFLEEWNSPSSGILLHTSGSTGNPKPFFAGKVGMRNSARATCRFLGLKPGDTALLCLPLDYIAGKMMVVRSVVCGLRLVCVEPSGHPLGSIDSSPDFAAMTPMQVFNSLQVPRERELLMGIRHLIIGGGAVDETVERELAGFPYAVWSTYGMTETLSHIALRRLNGAAADRWYTPFENVNVCIDSDGCLVIDAPAVCASTLHTNDIAVMASDGRRFRIIGRKDNVICSGGVKIQAEEVERLLGKHIHVPFIITKKCDAKFGEVVALVARHCDMPAIRSTCASVLPKYWRPRLYVPVDEIPFTATGKPARAEAMRLTASFTTDYSRY